MITKDQFMCRLEKACDFKRPIDESAIEKSLLGFAKNITSHAVKVVFLRNSKELCENGKAARAARDARDARAARAARDARDAWAARAARDARDALAAWAARAVWDARDARAAWAAWAAWAARAAWAAWEAWWDVSYMICSIAGAIEREDTGFADKWMPLFEAFESGAWLIWWTADTIFVATLPTVKRVAPQRLHCADGPAFVWCDMELYYLNAVLVEPWMVMTKPEDIDAKKVLSTTNVDQRRELIRRIGIDRILDHLPHKVMDTAGDYTLYAVDLSDELKEQRYLRMLNPSVKQWHVEAVSNDCLTVQHANNWRAKKDITKTWAPAQLT